MLVAYSRHKAAWSSTKGLIYLLLSGVLLCAIIAVFAIVFIVYQAQFFQQISTKTAVQKPLQAFNSLADAIIAESSVRVLNPGAYGPNVQKPTDQAFNTLTSSLDSLSSDTKGIKEAFSQYRLQTNVGSSLLLSQLTVLAESTKVLFTLIVDRLQSRAFGAVRRLVALRFSQSTASLASRVGFLEAVKTLSNSDGKLSVNEAIGLSIAQALYKAAADISVMDKITPLHKSIESVGQNILDASYGITPGDPMHFTTQLLPLTSMSAFFQRDLKAVDKASARMPLILMLIGLVAILAVMIVVGFIALRHNQCVKRTRRMVASFESEKHQMRLRSRYMPLFQQMRALSLPRTHKTEVEREYLIAARLLETIRVTVPQLLFGGVDAKRKEPATIAEEGTWRLTDEAIRLETGTTQLARATIMEIDLGGTQFVDQEGCDLTLELVRISAAYNIIVTEVNRSGGVVLGFRGGLRILAAWNAAHRKINAALTAVRVAWILSERLASLPPNLAPIKVTICIVRGRGVLVNQGLGKRRCALLLSSMFALLNKLQMVCRVKSYSILVDTATYEGFSADRFKFSCKPVLVIRDGETLNAANSEILYRADPGCEMASDQSVLYNSAFVLYQNNMFTEAASQFGFYLSSYPDDADALSLRNHCNMSQNFRIENR